jgi:hypothetical protein
VLMRMLVPFVCSEKMKGRRRSTAPPTPLSAYHRRGKRAVKTVRGTGGNVGQER